MTDTQTRKIQTEEIQTWEIEKIIRVAHELQHHGASAASISEVIAAAFVLNRADIIDEVYGDIVAAWDRLGDDWQDYVRQIKQDCMHLIEKQEER